MGYKKITGKWRKGKVVKRLKPQKGEVPSRRKAPWVTLIIRAEHYAMLRELAEFHGCTLGTAAMVLIQEEFIRQMAEIDPEKARQLEEAYAPLYKYGKD